MHIPVGSHLCISILVGKHRRRLLLGPWLWRAVPQGFRRDAEMKNIVLADATARDQAIRHFFGRALREARE
jgi:hypothetical protein